MKTRIFLLMLGVVAVACVSQKNAQKTGNNAPVLTDDSTRYEITLIDPDFDLWYSTHYTPALDRSNALYRSLNLTGVSNWNLYFTHNRHSGVVDSYINYNPSVDYGIEVNRKLFWYFTYIEQKFNIRLLR